MRIATWNINSVRLRIDQLAEFTQKYQPDVVALQETKTRDDTLPRSECMSMGYPHIRISG